MKTKKPTSEEQTAEQRWYEMHNNGSYDARESESVAQVERSDEEVAETWYNENEFTGSNKEAFLAGIRHGRASERANTPDYFEIKNLKEDLDAAYEQVDKNANACEAFSIEVDRLNNALEHERARSAKLVEALKESKDRINHSCNIEYGNNTGVENCSVCKSNRAIADYEREK